MTDIAPGDENEHPPVDVVIPCWTETVDFLGYALRSLRPYMRPIVMFNGPGAKEMAIEWFEDTTWDVLGASKMGFASDDYIGGERGGGCYLCHARNYGVELATSPYVAFLDADDLFLPGIDDVALAAKGRRGAWGDFVVGNADMERHTSQATAPAPRTGTFVLRREAVVPFDVWAPHQVQGKGLLYNVRWWKQVTQVDLKYVPVETMVYRHQWSDKQATPRYWANGGFIGVGSTP